MLRKCPARADRGLWCFMDTRAGASAIRGGTRVKLKPYTVYGPGQSLAVHSGGHTAVKVENACGAYARLADFSIATLPHYYRFKTNNNLNQQTL